MVSSRKGLVRPTNLGRADPALAAAPLANLPGSENRTSNGEPNRNHLGIYRGANLETGAETLLKRRTKNEPRLAVLWLSR